MKIKKLVPKPMDIRWDVAVPLDLFCVLDAGFDRDWLDRLEAVDGVHKVDYDGHFGPQVYFTTRAKNIQARDNFIRVLTAILKEIASEQH